MLRSPSRRRLRPLALLGALAVGAAVVIPAAIGPAAAAPTPWMDVSRTPAQRADALLAAMTLDDKLAMMHNTNGCAYAGCTPTSFSGGALPALHLQDGPLGVGDGVTGVTQMPAPVAGAATWDTALVQQYGAVLGQEHWGKGVNVALAPTVNIVRDPRWGRAFESFGEDPYLAGQIAAADINGIQSQGPMAQVKHLAAYNQETNRNTTADNVIASERTLREIYLPQFEAAVTKGNVASAMCSYSVINGQFACENSHLQKDIFKGDMGFQGFITADWGATHSTVASANNGLDMEMPDSNGFYGTALKNAVTGGQVSQATIDDHVHRILQQMFRFGLFDKTQTGTKDSPVTSAAHTAVARQVAAQGSVLLKNTANVLPVGSGVRSIAVVGAGAGAGALTQGGGSASVNASSLVTPYAGIKARAGSGVNVSYYQGNASADGAFPVIPTASLTPATGTGNGLSGQFFNSTDLSGSVVASRVDAGLDFTWGGASPAAGVGTVNWSARWTGKITPPATGTYGFSLTSDDGSRLYVNNQLVVNNWYAQGSTTRTGQIALTAGQPADIRVEYYQGGGGDNLSLGWSVPGQSAQDQAVDGAKNSDLAVVFVNKFQSEGSDTGDIELGATQNNLVSAVAAANPNTVVVLNTGSAVTMPWVNAVKGVVENWYPGQEAGNAIADVLFGDVNPSGKLPVSFPQSLADGPLKTAAQWPGQNGQVQYSEGLNVGYRWYDSKNVTPMFPFGFGLSYTTFAYSGLTVGQPDAAGNVAVGFDVKNTGTRAGSEVAQVYVGQPSTTGEPPKALQGFSKVSLAPGATSHVAITLPKRAFQYWGANGWTGATGTNAVLVGGSSRDIALTGSTTIGGTVTNPDPTETPLSRSGWTATASSSIGGDTPAMALDGNAGTRWSTGTPMAAGQTFTLDLGTARSLNQVTMDSGGSTGDYARGYTVALSANGSTWVDVKSGTGTSAVVTATFPEQTARYVRITQTGSAPSWWSVSEITAATSGTGTTDPGTGGTPVALSRTGWVASASPVGDPAANALDGNLNTRFSTGAAMVNGQTFTVDMGASKTFDQVVLDAGPSAGDYARGYTVQVSDNASTWTNLASGTGTTAKATVRFPNATGRYVRVVQTGAASSWWSIAEFTVWAG